MAEPMTNVTVLRKFFFRDGKDTLKSFMEEIKALSMEERKELGALAAKELGVQIAGE